MKLLFLFGISLLINLSLSHKPSFEGQGFKVDRKGEHPLDPGDDWNFDTPFILQLGLGRDPTFPNTTCPGFTETPNPALANETCPGFNNWSELTQRRVLYSVLTDEDQYDVIQFDVVTSELILATSPLTFNCPLFQSFYPSIALLGNASDTRFNITPDDIDEDWADLIPEGYGAIIKHQPRLPRSVFPSTPEEGGGPGYLLPIGLNETCLRNHPFPNCDFGNTINGMVLGPGRYYFVAYDTHHLYPKPHKPRNIVWTIGGFENETPVENAYISLTIEANIIPGYVVAPKC